MLLGVNGKKKWKAQALVYGRARAPRYRLLAKVVQGLHPVPVVLTWREKVQLGEWFDCRAEFSQAIAPNQSALTLFDGRSEVGFLFLKRVR